MNHIKTREQVGQIQHRYPPGTRLELICMENDPRPLSRETRGEVVAVDDAGQLVMRWDNGRSLSLIPCVDQFRKLTAQEIAKEQTMTMGGMQL